MKKSILLFFACVLAVTAVDAQLMTDIRVLSEDQSSLVIEFTPQIKTEYVTGNQGTVFTRFLFYGSQTAYDSSGRTDFIRPLLLLLPSDGFSLQVIASEYQTRDSVKLLPKPTIIELKELGYSETYDDSSFERTAYAPEQKILAAMTNVGKTSIGHVGTLVLHPVQAVDREKARIYSRIVVRIDFRNSFPAGLKSTCLMRGEKPSKAHLQKMIKASYKQSAKTDFPLTQGSWYRIDVTETGMYKLGYSYFSGLNITDINSIRLFGNGGQAIPDDNTTPRPNGLEEISRLVCDQNSNGVFDPDDYIIFFGRGTSGWNYVYDGSSNFKHYINPYSEKNFYFFTYNQGNGRQMDTVSASAVSPSAIKPTGFQEKMFIEEEKFNLQNSGRRWAGEYFSGTDEAAYNRTFHGLMASSKVTYKFKFLRNSSYVDNLEIFENGQSILKNTLNRGGSSDYYASEVSFTAWGNTTGAGEIKIQVTGNQESKTWLDWIEMFYDRNFEAVNDALFFHTHDSFDDIVQYDISNFSGNVRAFDVTEHGNVKELKFYSADPTMCRIQVQLASRTVREIAVIGTNGYKTPVPPVKIDNTINLHNTQSQYDFVIISPTEFLTQANQLKTHRETRDSLRTLVVDINHIYSEFGGGIPDVLAIREFVRYTRDNWTGAPQYFLLFGWGHFDYKNKTTSKKNWIPPFEPEESFNIVNSSYPTDDKFVLLDPNVNVYFAAIGRLPVRSAEEASIVVNKIISYETNAFADSSAWRNVLTFVADDGWTPERDDEAIYTHPSERFAESNSAKKFEVKKIFIIEYPTVNSASGRRKPDANKAIVEAINQGTLFMNFIGHGNDQLWAHEHIFVQDDEFPKLKNKDKLPFIFAATCSYSKYDGPNVLSSGEQLVTMENGAIGTYAASRAVQNTRNVNLNNAFFEYLFLKDANGRASRLGDASKYAKSTILASAGNDDVENAQKFHLFADPTLRLTAPKNVTSIDSVNGHPATSLVEMKSLAHVPVRGSMRLNDGTPVTSFQGKGILQVFDSQRDVQITEGSATFIFKKKGSLLYRGGVTIQDGKFNATIPIPKDVTFGNRSRISMYAWNDAVDGTGYTENIMINGVDSAASANNDGEGPQISVYMNDLDFRSGDAVNINPTLIVKFYDESGINTSAAGVGHQLSASINNDERIINLSNYYQSDYDTYKSGEARYQLNDLGEGKYTLRVKAWDIQNNSAEAEVYFTITLADNLSLLNVVNYPNPFTSSTTFTFQRTGVDPVDVEVKIYTIAGRLIGRLNAYNITDRSVKIPWDGRDSDGGEIANGVYLYKLIARTLDGRNTSEAIGKLAVVR
ncbi:MAG: type IX secretion system sortase PorU [Bacteroidetes bacterium]|nr:type IX secretion system sortase PorU [Bacteroidota bacterium]